jgi:tellurite resistance protein
MRTHPGPKTPKTAQACHKAAAVLRPNTGDVDEGHRMKPARITALAILAASLSLPVEARTTAGISGSYEFMEFVADYAAPAGLTGGKTLSLCHLIGKTHAFYIPIHFASKGYVLAENRCETGNYLPFPADQFSLARATGAIPALTPDQPSIGLARQLPPFGLGLLLLIGAAAGMRRMRRSQFYRNDLSELPTHVQRVLSVACHAARSDSDVGDEKIDMIAAIVQRTTDVEVKASQIRRVVANCEKSLQQQDFMQFGKGLAATQKELLLKVALIVVGSDGAMNKGEQKFLSGLASGLSISTQRFQRIVAEIG